MSIPKTITMGVTFIKGRNIRKVCVCVGGGEGQEIRAKESKQKKMCKAKLKKENKEKYLPLKFRNKFQHKQTAKKFVQAENSLPRPPPPLKKL
jgi:hypothetical protein